VLRTLSPNLIRTSGIQLTVIFLQCVVIGYLLVSYQATLVIWLLIEVMILHLAWAGTGAIASSVVGALGIVWSATLSTPIPEDLVWPGVPLDPAQIWAGKLLLNWLLANSLIFMLGFMTRFLRSSGQTRNQTFCLVMTITNLGLLLAQLSRVSIG
jgi:hypothetical protein